MYSGSSFLNIVGEKSQFFNVFSLSHRKHAPFAKCFSQISAAFCHTSGSTSTNHLTSALSVVPVVALSTSSHMWPKTVCITLGESATGALELYKLGFLSSVMRHSFFFFKTCAIETQMFICIVWNLIKIWSHVAPWFSESGHTQNKMCLVLAFHSKWHL